MAETLPAAPQPTILTPLTNPAGGSAMTRLRAFTGQGAVRRAIPLFLGVSAIGLAGLAWATLAPSPQRTLYSTLNDIERASVAGALDQAGIAYRIDNGTGAVTVDEGDYYRARMLAASDGSLATPESGQAMLDSLPMGASRTLEGERLRAAREHDLVLTIMEIEGVEAVRVHLAQGEKSVFVRDNSPPSASVMLRLAKGRQLGDSQVSAIVNLVAGSAPGMSPDAVQVADQHGRLLSDAKGNADNARLDLQGRMEDKLRTQIAQLLTPMLGEGNFTSEIQIELDMDQVTTARESYDKDGVVRSETQQQSSTTGPGQAGGVPGVMSNTPPPAATASPGPPQGTPAAAASPGPVNGDSSTTRTYELGREVAVANSTPGKLKRLSVAVAVSAKALKDKAGVDQIKQLVSAAVGADPQRGDQIAVIARNFSPVEAEGLAFYEAPWFASLVRTVVALLAVLLVLLLGVKPMIKALKREPGRAASDSESDGHGPSSGTQVRIPASRQIDPEMLNRQVGLAQQMVTEKPESAAIALRQMLNEADSAGAA